MIEKKQNSSRETLLERARLSFRLFIPLTADYLSASERSADVGGALRRPLGPQNVLPSAAVTALLPPQRNLTKVLFLTEHAAMSLVHWLRTINLLGANAALAGSRRLPPQPPRLQFQSSGVL